ncbi:MAG: hypothetical protein K0M60_17365, partial [Hydrogenophaga sp.]|nr:hypothetical protein [Hydrogenophaga sp.]
RGVNVMDTPIVERSAFREIFDCGGTLYSMDAARISNLDKARENAQAYAGEVRRLMPTMVIRSQERRRLFGFVLNAALSSSHSSLAQ